MTNAQPAIASAYPLQNVVVVDDAETNVDILATMISSRANTCAHGFTSSSEALAYAGTNAVDGFVLDYNMPHPDGLEMIRLLRADPRYRFVPIVIVTAEHEREKRLRALLAGANDFIERPIEPRELRARLDTLLNLESARLRLAANVSELEHSLVVAEQRSRAQAERLAALWKIVSNASLSPEDTAYGILSEGASALRAGHHFFGSLYRVDGDDVVLEARAPVAAPRGPADLRPGTRLRLADTICSKVTRAGETRAWADLRDDPDARELKRVIHMGGRAAICTSFRAGRSTYMLLFWSQQPLESPFTDDDVTYVGLLSNFFASRVEQAWQADRMTYHLSHDILTGLLNRTQFRLDARTAYSVHGSGTMAVISLNGFRAINETYGHITGDALLVEVGAALQKRAIGDDVVARLAGDTFGIFLPGFGDEKNAHVRLRMIAEAFERPFSTGDREGKEFIPLTATIGAFVAPDRTMSIETMIAHAETAVFAAKRDRSDAICVYESGMESAEAATKRLSGEIAAAIERDEFEMYFQPHVDLETMHVAGAEALIRWNHPTRGLLLPDEFVPFAEQHNQIKAISTWVIRSVLRAAATFRAIDPAFRVYFNLSAADITDMSIVNDLRDAAARGASLENIGVELTETMAMRDVGTAVQTIKALRDLGVHVAIDDFGVGYSSLSLLKRIPVDIVKIDRSFVHEILSDPRDAAIAEAVITFGRQFGFKTLGEGVETPEQRDWLASSNCRYAQGYFIARPAPLDRFVDWLTNR